MTFAFTSVHYQVTRFIKFILVLRGRIEMKHLAILIIALTCAPAIAQIVRYPQ